ncbi:2392_t:CDS:2, partial [Ambispora leptoticha]
VPPGIYRKGPKKKKKSIFHDEEVEKELHQLAVNLTQKSSFYTSLRNFQQKTLMNFTPEDFDRGLYFSTFTFNNYQKKMSFSFSPWRKKRKCPVSGCNGKHFYQRVSHLTSSFLAEKKIAKKRMGRNLEGANDLFNQAISDIQKKHDCHRNWHIHMLSTNFLPVKYNHEVCGLVDIKQLSHLKISNKPIKSAEGVVVYLTKYLAKSFSMRANLEQAKKSGLLSGMKIYKFFQASYGNHKEIRAKISASDFSLALSSEEAMA